LIGTKNIVFFQIVRKTSDSGENGKCTKKCARAQFFVHFVKESGSKNLVAATQRLLNAKMWQMGTYVFLRLEVMVSGELSLDMIHEINGRRYSCGGIFTGVGCEIIAGEKK
jgi:hypothetical protein